MPFCNPRVIVMLVFIKFSLSSYLYYVRLFSLICRSFKLDQPIYPSLTYTPVTRRSVNAVKPPRLRSWETGRLLRDFYNTLRSGHTTRHDIYATPSRLIEGTTIRSSYDFPTNCATDPRLVHDLHGIIILIHDRRTTPSRRLQDSCVMLLGYIKSCSWSNCFINDPVADQSSCPTLHLIFFQFTSPPWKSRDVNAIANVTYMHWRPPSSSPSSSTGPNPPSSASSPLAVPE